MASSDERRAAAQRLREYGRDTLKDGSLLKTLKDVTGADSWRHVLLALADLMEPDEGDDDGDVYLTHASPDSLDLERIADELDEIVGRDHTIENFAQDWERLHELCALLRKTKGESGL